MAKSIAAFVLTIHIAFLVPAALGQSSEEVVIEWLRSEQASLLDVGNLKLELHLQKEIGRTSSAVSRNDVTVYYDPAAQKIFVARAVHLGNVGGSLNSKCRGYLNEVRTELGIDVQRGKPRLPYESKVGEIYVPPELLTVKVGREIEKTIQLLVTVETDDSEYACAGGLTGVEILRQD